MFVRRYLTYTKMALTETTGDYSSLRLDLAVNQSNPAFGNSLADEIARFWDSKEKCPVYLLRFGDVMLLFNERR